MIAEPGSDQLAVTVDLDLGEFRSRIVDLCSQSIGLATDLLAVLGPLPRDTVPGAVPRQPQTDIVELTRIFDDPPPAMIGSGRPYANSGAVLDLVRVG